MPQGEFSGEPITKWVTEEDTHDRAMCLIERFSFVDRKGKQWDAPEKAHVDGASIPRALWTIVGSPYTGDYRRASIVHDVACVEAGEDPERRKAADKMFYEACRAGGCSIRESIILYVGVRIGAWVPNVPAWHAAAATESEGPRVRQSEAERQLERDFQAIAERVLMQGEVDDPEELEHRTEEALLIVAAVSSGSGEIKYSRI